MKEMKKKIEGFTLFASLIGVLGLMIAPPSLLNFVIGGGLIILALE